jgi:uncharacterized protein
MTIFLTVLGTFLFIMAIMAVGVIFGRKPLAGSCGGVGRALNEDDYECPICGDDPARCEKQGGGGSPGAESKSWYEAR